MAPVDLHELKDDDRFLKAVHSKFGDPAVTNKGQNPTKVVASVVKLGKLGDGVIVTQLGGMSVCTAMGNCGIYVMYSHLGRIVTMQLADGWTYAVVPGAKGIPDIVVEQSTSVSTGIAIRYHYKSGKYQATGCDAVTLKNDEVHPMAAILDTDKVDVKPCPAGS